MSFSTTIDPKMRIIPLEEFPLALFVTSIVCFAVAMTSVSLRTYIRVSKGVFGIDDGFMLAGTIIFGAVVGIACYGCFVGLGRLEKDLNLWQWQEAMKYYIIFILTYVISLAIVKSSVCLTIFRIATTMKPLRISVLVLLAVNWCSFFITFIGTLLYCRPVETIWTIQLRITTGKCAPVDTFIIIGHVATVSTILTDLALVIVPGVLMWQTQMKRQAKIQAWALLSFASLASIITMVRIPYVNKFKGGTNLQFWVAHTVLCSVLEIGIGCTASSLPSVRHFIRRNHESSGSGPSNKRSGERSQFFTVGSEPRKGQGSQGYIDNTLDTSISLRPLKTDGNWQRLQDDGSGESLDDKKIYVDKTVTVDVQRSMTPSLDDEHFHSRR